MANQNDSIIRPHPYRPKVARAVYPPNSPATEICADCFAPKDHPAHHQHTPVEADGFVVCSGCRDILCDCGKGEWCPQYGEALRARRGRR